MQAYLYSNTSLLSYMYMYIAKMLHLVGYSSDSVKCMVKEDTYTS